MSDRKEIHDRVLNATNTAELMGAYKDWADRYDTELLGEMGYVAPMITVGVLEDFLSDKTARILDVGCGTGIVGELLTKDGFQNVDGLDYSEEMLGQAEAKGIYGALSRGDLKKKLDLADNAYDAMISVGTFTLGHVGPEAFGELIRIVRPGGLLCFTVREQAWEEADYRRSLRAYENDGLWELVELRTADYLTQEGSRCKICLYKVVS